MESKKYDKNKKNKNFSKDQKGSGKPRNGKINRDDNKSRDDESVEEGIIYGRNPVLELLNSDRLPDKIYVSSGDREGSITLIVAKAIDLKIPVVNVDKRKLDMMSGGGNHQGVCAKASFKDYCTVDEILSLAEERGESPFIVISDGIEDPGNLGALIRCCECAGVHGLIIPKRHGATVNSTTAKASAGALEHLLVAKVTNISQTVEELKKKGVWIYGAEAGGTNMRTTDLTGPAAFVFGSEGDGISRIVSEKCDFIISINMFGKVNSLNVSCAASAILAEASFQRNNK